MTLNTIPRPRLGLGLAALGRPGYINLGHAIDLGAQRTVNHLEAQAQAMLDAAYLAGVRDFDVARSYGHAEAFLARWLASRAHPPDELRISSKWGYRYTADWRINADVHEIKDHRLEAFMEQWPQSHALLGRHLHLYQIHSVTPESPALDNPQLLEALLERKQQGLRIGLSTSGPQQAQVIERAIGVRVAGIPLFDAVQATYNLLERAAGDALANAHAAGLTVLVKEALANGRLTERNHAPDFAPRLRLLREHAHALDTSVDALALALVLQQPWVTVVLSGAAQPAHLHSNLRALTLSADALQALDLTELAQTSSHYWRTRAALPWT